MNFTYVVHQMCWNYLIALIDLITHSGNRNNSANGDHNAKRARPFDVAVNAVAFVVCVSAVCDQADQGDQVVLAHQVDDIDEVRELDPVHQVDHKDECTDFCIYFSTYFPYNFVYILYILVQTDGLSSFLEKKDFDPSGFCIKSSYQDPVREFCFFAVLFLFPCFLFPAPGGLLIALRRVGLLFAPRLGGVH